MTIKLNVNDKLVSIAKYELIVLVIAFGLLQMKIGIVTYIDKNYLSLFLQNGVLATHSPKQLATTTQSLHIEYQVLKVPTSKTIGAKK